MSAQKLIGMSLAELAEAYASRSLSPVEVVNDVITHAEAVNGSINALFCFRPEQAIAGARQSEARWKAKAALGPLDGVPMTVKDSVAMVGWPYFHGIGANRSLPPSNYDSPPAIALREAGAVIFAKTTMPDCGLMARPASVLCMASPATHGGSPGIPADHPPAPALRSPRAPDSFQSGRISPARSGCRPPIADWHR